MRLETEIAQARASQEVADKMGLPRLFSVESQFRIILLEAELDFARSLATDIVSGALGGVDWWKSVHDGSGEQVALPPFIEER